MALFRARHGPPLEGARRVSRHRGSAGRATWLSCGWWNPTPRPRPRRGRPAWSVGVTAACDAAMTGDRAQCLDPGRRRHRRVPATCSARATTSDLQPTTPVSSAAAGERGRADQRQDSPPALRCATPYSGARRPPRRPGWSGSGCCHGGALPVPRQCARQSAAMGPSGSGRLVPTMRLRCLARICRRCPVWLASRRCCLARRGVRPLGRAPGTRSKYATVPAANSPDAPITSPPTIPPRVVRRRPPRSAITSEQEGHPARPTGVGGPLPKLCRAPHRVGECSQAR